MASIWAEAAVKPAFSGLFARLLLQGASGKQVSAEPGLFKSINAKARTETSLAIVPQRGTRHARAALVSQALIYGGALFPLWALEWA